MAMIYFEGEWIYDNIVDCCKINHVKYWTIQQLKYIIKTTDSDIANLLLDGIVIDFMISGGSLNSICIKFLLQYCEFPVNTLISYGTNLCEIEKITQIIDLLGNGSLIEDQTNWDSVEIATNEQMLLTSHLQELLTFYYPYIKRKSLYLRLSSRLRKLYTLAEDRVIIKYNYIEFMSAIEDLKLRSDFFLIAVEDDQGHIITQSQSLILSLKLLNVRTHKIYVILSRTIETIRHKLLDKQLACLQVCNGNNLQPVYLTLSKFLNNSRQIE